MNTTGFDHDFSFVIESEEEVPVSFVRVINTEPKPHVAATGVIVTPEILELKVGETTQISETLKPTNATNQFVTWSSSNTSVASVSNGLVSAASIGSATITVTTNDGEFTDSCVVTVIPSVTISNCPSAYLMEGNTHQLTAVVSQANTDDPGLVWSSSNASVATVNASGLVTAVSTGSATITVKTNDGSLTDSCMLNVIPFGETQNLLINGDFAIADKADPGFGWELGVNARDGATAELNVVDGQAEITISQIGTAAAQIRLFQTVDLISWHDYELTFEYKGSEAMTGGIRYFHKSSDGERPNTTYADVTTDMQVYSLTWTQTVGEPTEFAIQFGKYPGTLTIKNVKLIDISSTASINETKLKLINLYSNPVNNGSLKISTSVNIDQLQIFDITGKKVHQELNLGTNATLDLSKLYRGLYIIRFESSQGNESKKIIIE